jgi:hypothetical protein
MSSSHCRPSCFGPDQTSWLPISCLHELNTSASHVLLPSLPACKGQSKHELHITKQAFWSTGLQEQIVTHSKKGNMRCGTHGTRSSGESRPGSSLGCAVKVRIWIFQLKNCHLCGFPVGTLLTGNSVLFYFLGMGSRVSMRKPTRYMPIAT